MPNGRPGDHPLTDILNHGYDLYGEGLDNEIRALIARHPDLRPPVSALLWENPPPRGQLKPVSGATRNAVAEGRAALRSGLGNGP